MKSGLTSFSKAADLGAVGASLLLCLGAPACSPARAATAPALQPVLLAVEINREPVSDFEWLLKDDAGRLYASAKAIQAWRLNIEPAETIAHDGEAFHRLSDVPGVAYRIDEATQSLLIEADPKLLPTTSLSLGRRHSQAIDLDSNLGGFANYDLYGQHVEGGHSTLNGVFELGGFFGAAAFTMDMLVRDLHESPEPIRLDTTWVMDWPDRMMSLRLGDGITRGGVGGAPLRFGGLQIARNFAVQPGYITTPMPTITGSAALPSTVDVYVNGRLRAQQEVSPGPFEIQDLPVVTGAGEVRLVVRDVLGRESVITQPYYASATLLRQGLGDYAYEIGFLRERYAIESNGYGPLALSGTHRYGMTDWLTVEAHVEGTLDRQVAGLGAAALWPSVGVFSASAAASADDEAIGGLVGLGFSRHTTDLSFGLRTEIATDEYTHLGLADEAAAPATTTQAFVGIPFDYGPLGGSLGATYGYRDRREGLDTEFLSASAMLSLGPLGSLRIAGLRSLTEEEGAMVSLNWIMRTGPGASVSSSVQRHGDNLAVTAAATQSPPLGEGVGYRASVTRGQFDRVQAEATYQNGIGAYSAELARSGDQVGVRASASGGVGLIGTDYFLSRKLTQSFAAVDVGEFEGVRVYADNQLVGTTDTAGRAIVPRLRSYEANSIRIDPTDLPLDVEIGRVEQTVHPGYRSGVTISFPARLSRGALMTVVREDGTPLPAGASLRLEGMAGEFVSAPEGSVYLTGLARESVVHAEWDRRRCSFRIAFPETEDPQPHLGIILCRGS